MEQRTPEELGKAEFNYFIALNLSITETNKAVIEKAINKLLGNPSGDLLTRRLLLLRDDIKETMLNNAELRKAEAERAKKFKLDEIMILVQSTCLSNGMLFKSELTDLCNAANKNAKYFEFADLEKRFLEFNKGGAVKYIDNTTNVIPFAKFDKVTTLLEAPPARESLYEFLGISPTASVQEIESARKTVYDEAQKKSDLKVKQAASNLCSEAQEILLKDPAVRKQYDYYIKVRSKVWNQFKLRKTYGAKDMSLKMYYDFAEILRQELGLGVDEVQDMLGAGLKFYNLVVSGGDADSETKGKLGIKDLELCPYDDCGKVYESGAKVCPHCGRPLEVVCWNCSGNMPFTSKSKTCPQCGASYQAREQFEKLFSQARSAFNTPGLDLVRLESSVAALRTVVGNYKAFPQSYVFTKIAECEKELNKRKEVEATTGAQYREAMEAVNALIALRNFVQAKNAAENMKRKFATYCAADTQKKIMEIDAALQKAQAALQSAKACIARRDENGAVDWVVKALEFCADFNEAKQFIANYPPHPPTAVAAQVAGQTVKLTWRIPAANNIRYNVVRKVGAAPKTPEDGTVVAADLTIDFFEDKNVASATPYYYGVYAERGGVKSAIAPCLTPAQVFLDVSGVRQEMTEDKICVKWTVPDNVKEVEVWKKRGIDAPLSAGDGVKLSGVEKTGFTDSDCAGENSYLILCKYEINGVKYLSKGVSRVFKRFEIPKSLEKAEIKQLTACEFLFVGEAKGGNLKLLFAREKLACRTDALLQADGWTDAVKGSNELKLSYSGNEITFMLPPDTLGFVYPAVCNDQLFIIGKPIEVNSVCGVKNLAYCDNGNTGMLTGVLHPAVVSVTAKISEKAFVEKFDEPADSMKLSADEFKKEGGFKLTLKRNVNYYVTLFAEVEANGKRMICMGENLDEPICQRDKTIVKYCLEYKVVPMKPVKITLKFAADSQIDLPELLIVKGAPRPMEKSRGELVEKLKKATLKKGLFSKDYTYKVTVNAAPMARNMQISIFPADDAGYVQFREVKTL